MRSLYWAQLEGEAMIEAKSEIQEEQLRKAVDELNRIEHETGWARVRAIAAVLLRYREPSEEQAPPLSLRRLAAHPDCPLSKSQLRDALAAFRIFQEEGLVRSSSFLTPSHVAVVTSLEPSDRLEVLRDAEKMRWSVRELEARVREFRRGRGERRGRPPTSPGEKAVTRYDNAVLCLEEAFELLPEEGLSEDVHDQLLRLLDRVYALWENGVTRLAVVESPPLSGEVLRESLGQSREKTELSYSHWVS